jgi:hypothetical protein
MNGLIGAWCPSLGATGTIALDRTKYHRDLTLATYEFGQGYGGSGSGMAFDFQPGFGGAYTYDISRVPSYSTGQFITVSGWHSPRSLGADEYYWNNAIFEIATDNVEYGQRLILQASYDPNEHITYVFTDGVFAENNLYILGAPTLNQWYHYCFVITGQEFQFYLNGNLNQYGTFAFDYLLDPAYFLNVGYRDGWDNYDGHIDDVRLYNRALTGAEVKALASRRGIGLEQQRWRRRLRLPDLSDLLDRDLKRKQNALSQKEEEQIAAQLLQERQLKTKSTNKIKKAVDWKNLILEKINGVQTTEELNAISTTTESVEITAAVLAEIEQNKELKRIELELAQKEAELKALELTKAIEENEKAIALRLKEQEHQLQILKGLQDQVFERLRLAEAAALEEERKAAYEAQIAEQRYLEFKQKRDNRIKRLKALMWLAKLDI